MCLRKKWEENLFGSSSTLLQFFFIQDVDDSPASPISREGSASLYRSRHPFLGIYLHSVGPSEAHSQAGLTGLGRDGGAASLCPYKCLQTTWVLKTVLTGYASITLLLLGYRDFSYE